MSKRKRTGTGKTSPGADTKPASDEPAVDADDAAVKENMAHVGPDMLAGSPDIFASRPSIPSGEPEAAAEPAVVEPPAEEPADSSPGEAASPSTEAETAEPIEAPPPPPAESPALAAPPPATTPGAYPTGVGAPPARRRGGSSTALGIVLVVVGVFALGIVVFGIDLTSYGWPLFVIIPGLTLLVVGFVGLGPGASIPGGILTMLGLVLAYQSATGDWPSWAFAWALVAPFGVGLGVYLQALRDRNQGALRRGRNLMFAGAIIFMIGFVFFESILGISGTDYGIFGKAALPALLIIIGIILLVRSVQRSRRA